jgi:hypothetical protein
MAASQSHTLLPFSLSNGSCYADAFPWWPRDNQQLVEMVAFNSDSTSINRLPIVFGIFLVAIIIIASFVAAVFTLYHLWSNRQNFSPMTYLSSAHSTHPARNLAGP